MVLVGQNDPGPIDLDAIDDKLARPEYAPVVESLAEVGFYSASQLMATFAAKRPELDPWIADAQLPIAMRPPPDLDVTTISTVDVSARSGGMLAAPDAPRPALPATPEAPPSPSRDAPGERGPPAGSAAQTSAASGAPQARERPAAPDVPAKPGS